MRTMIVGGVALLCLILGASPPVRADAVTDCAKLQGKAQRAAFKAVFREAMKACGKGFAGAAAPVSSAAAGKSAGKAGAGIGKGVDKFGVDNCRFDVDTLNAVDQRAMMQSIADQACQVAP